MIRILIVSKQVLLSTVVFAKYLKAFITKIILESAFIKDVNEAFSNKHRLWCSQLMSKSFNLPLLYLIYLQGVQ